jgi:HEAT repeat protein
LIQTVGHKRLINLARQLTRVIEQDPDLLCRQAAIWSAGHLRADECLPTLLKLAENPPAELRWNLTWALKEYGSIEARGYLERQFDDTSTEDGARMIAA